MYMYVYTTKTVKGLTVESAKEYAHALPWKQQNGQVPKDKKKKKTLVSSENSTASVNVKYEMQGIKTRDRTHRDTTNEVVDIAPRTAYKTAVKLQADSSSTPWITQGA